MSERLLVVDDEDAIRFAMTQYFTAHGYEVDCAQDRLQAETQLAGSEYALIIADISLSGDKGTEGLDVVREVRKRFPETPVVVLTAYATPETMREAQRCGATRTLHKPLPLPELGNVVFDLLARNRHQAKSAEEADEADR